MPETVIIRLKTCPVRLLGPYGCEWIETPNLDRLAANGIVFDSHIVSGKVGQEYYAGKAIPFESFDPTLAVTESLLVEWDAFADWAFEEIDLIDADSRAEFLGELRDAIQEWDAELEPIVALSARVTVALTAMVGLPVGEHDAFGIEQSRLHNELVQIPLIVSYPDRRLAGYRISGLTTHLALTEIPSGKFTESDAIVTWNDFETALRTADSSLILPEDGINRPSLLYEMPNDRSEVNDLFVRLPDRVDELTAKMREIRSRMEKCS